MMMTNVPQVLDKFYDATTFWYLNKVGENSRPNAKAIFAGRSKIKVVIKVIQVCERRKSNTTK
jgi:hypothetical protein